MADLTLITIGRDAYQLEGGMNTTEVIGTLAEWLVVAEWLRRPGSDSVRVGDIFIRPWAKSGMHLSSAQAFTTSDGVALTRGQSAALAEHIATLRAGENTSKTLGAS